MNVSGLPGAPAPHPRNSPLCFCTHHSSHRHPELIRLTGRHPFNCEPPPARLFDDYITPPSLHYVRNHGAVPQIRWEEHRLAVNGG